MDPSHHDEPTPAMPTERGASEPDVQATGRAAAPVEPRAIASPQVSRYVDVQAPTVARAPFPIPLPPVGGGPLPPIFLPPGFIWDPAIGPNGEHLPRGSELMLFPFPDALVLSGDVGKAVDFLRTLGLPSMLALNHLHAFGAYVGQKIDAEQLWRISVMRGRRFRGE